MELQSEVNLEDIESCREGCRCCSSVKLAMNELGMIPSEHPSLRTSVNPPTTAGRCMADTLHQVPSMEILRGRPLEVVGQIHRVAIPTGL